MMQSQDEVSTESEFSIISSSPAVWKMITSTILTLSEDSTFDVDAEGVRTRAIDSSHVALIDIKVPSAAFQKYVCSMPTRFTLHVEDFAKIVKRSESKDTFEISKTRKSNLSIKIGTGKTKREFELNLLENNLKTSPIPKLAFTTKFTISLLTFIQILTDISTLSTYISVVASQNAFVLSGRGDSGKVQIELNKENHSLFQETDTDQELKTTKAVYNLEYLLKIAKAVSSFSELVRFEYSTKMPLRLEFLRWDRQISAPVQLYLAPRILD
jgi:proliferating cell nuclear antigen